jgi:hypothetical protein
LTSPTPATTREASSATAGTTSTAPLFPFGHGLSYGDYRYAEPWVELNAATGVFTVSIEVTNVTAQEGTEVAQLYVVPPAIAEETAPTPMRLHQGAPGEWR